MGIWNKLGDYLYIGMAVFFFLSVLFGDFELVRVIWNTRGKLIFFCFLPRFTHIQILGKTAGLKGSL